MADISDVLGVRTGSRAFTQAYLSRSIVSTLFNVLPLPFFMLQMDGNKRGMLGIGIPSNGSLIAGKSTSARSREKQIFGAESYQPLIHSTAPKSADSTSVGMRASQMPTVGGDGATVTPTFQAVMGGSGTQQYVGTVTLLSGGLGLGGANGAASTIGTLTGLGGGGSGFSGTVSITSGVANGTVGIVASGGSYIGLPLIMLTSGGTSTDQHFARPFTKWYELVTPMKVFKKPMRRLKNLMYGASKADKEMVLSDILKSAVDEARAEHMTILSQEMWGITTTNGVPSDQTAEVFDHLLSAPASMHTTNTYAGVDRSVSANTYWLGKRQTANKAANLVSLYNEAVFTNGIADIGISQNRLLMMCGPSLFPQFLDQARGSGGITVYNDGLPEFQEFGAKGGMVLKYRDMWVVYDPMCPDKLKVDPRATNGTDKYTKNAVMLINLDTFTIGFSPEAKFSVDEPFDMTKIDGEDALHSRMRTEMFMINEAPAGSFYWEDVG